LFDPMFKHEFFFHTQFLALYKINLIRDKNKELNKTTIDWGLVHIMLGELSRVEPHSTHVSRYRMYVCRIKVRLKWQLDKSTLRWNKMSSQKFIPNVGESTQSPSKFVITSIIFRELIFLVMYGHRILDYFCLF